MVVKQRWEEVMVITQDRKAQEWALKVHWLKRFESVFVLSAIMVLHHIHQTLCLL
jgi:hypothetical protein